MTTVSGVPGMPSGNDENRGDDGETDQMRIEGAGRLHGRPEHAHYAALVVAVDEHGLVRHGDLAGSDVLGSAGWCWDC